ncbi:MAG TPA: hypothetical protein VF401_00215, partial [Candidatus Saccharimonadales bacterium]
HDVVRALFHAQPISQEDLDRATETELTRAARGSVENASQILAAENEFSESSFTDKKAAQAAKKKETVNRKKARKTERKRKTAAKRRKGK